MTCLGVRTASIIEASAAAAVRGVTNCAAGADEASDVVAESPVVIENLGGAGRDAQDSEPIEVDNAAASDPATGAGTLAVSEAGAGAHAAGAGAQLVRVPL